MKRDWFRWRSTVIGLVMTFLLSSALASPNYPDSPPGEVETITVPAQAHESTAPSVQTHNTDHQPTYIRVYRRSTGTIDHVDFYYYVNHSLPFEWSAQSKAAAYEAGALAVKSFGWYWIVNGPHPQSGSPNADVDDTAVTQIYKDQSITGYPNSQTAVNATASLLLLKSDSTVYNGQHLKGTYADDRGSTADDKLSQEGSRYLADQNWTRNSILIGYYTNPAVTIGSTTPPEVRKLAVTSVTSNSITFSWDPVGGATTYWVLRWNPSTSQWDSLGTPQSTSWTDSSRAPNQWYYYSVCAGNARGFGRCAFDGGYITASLFWNSTVPTYAVHFISDQQIRFTYSKPNATEYEVQKNVSGTWQAVYTGTNTEYQETGLSPNTPYEYRIRAKVNGVWSEFTNGGTFTIWTYPTR